MNETWSCCGHDLIGLCRTADCGVPDHCFFCGKPRNPSYPDPRSEDRLALLMANMWETRRKEMSGVAGSACHDHLINLGKADAEAWRTVARKVLDLLGPTDPVPESQPTRDELIDSIQSYAEEWKTGRSTMHSAAKIRLISSLDRHEFSLTDRTILRAAQALRTVTRLR